jgi:hypothetical protein
MNTIEIKLNEPVSINFICPKGDIFKMAVSCEGVVVTPPTPPTPPTTSDLSDRAKQAAADVRNITSLMVKNDPTTLRKIGTAYYTLKLNNLYTIEAESTALAQIVGYEPAAFIVVFNGALEADRPDVCAGIVNEIHTTLVKEGLPGVY